MGTSEASARRRRIGGWGFEGVRYPPSPALLAWLGEQVGAPGAPLGAEGVAPPSLPSRSLPELGCYLSTDPIDRFAHARGQGLADVIRLRAGLVPALPDAVCRPASADEVEAVLGACAATGLRVVPWGGGTSVTGGVNVLAGDAPLVTLDLARLAGLLELDRLSGLARFGAGTTGPALEAALAGHDLTLGHFPQSWELATVGGWAATRSSGQESLGYGRIEEMVAGLELVAPAGRLSLPALPASAAGPDLRQLVLGAEGRLGVITEVVVRVRPRPATTIVEAALVPDLGRGFALVRSLARSGLPLTMLRLSDPAETEVATAIGLASRRFASLARRYLRLRGIGAGACLLLVGAAGEPEGVRTVLRCARSYLRAQRAVPLGRRPGRRWLADRFRHPYLREELLELGYATDTLETATTWAAAPQLRERVASAIAGALEDEDQRVAVLCHLSHPYRDGVSLYFTFFFRSAPGPEQTLARWAAVKRAATAAIVAGGATVSHHHGVGQWHAPWLEPEVGAKGLDLLAAAAREMDPEAILNPHVLLDPLDRLEA